MSTTIHDVPAVQAVTWPLTRLYKILECVYPRMILAHKAMSPELLRRAAVELFTYPKYVDDRWGSAFADVLRKEIRGQLVFLNSQGVLYSLASDHDAFSPEDLAVLDNCDGREAA